MSTLLVNGVAASRATFVEAAFGLWWLDVDLVEGVELARLDSPSIVFGGVPLVGAVVMGGASEGRASYRIAGGRGKWGDTIAAKPYRNDAGVKASAVITDAASACGEVLDPASVAAYSSRLGPHYARAEGPAVDALNLLAPRQWRVGRDGVTYLGERIAAPYVGDSRTTAKRLDAGVVEVSTETILGLEPGVTVDGGDPVTDLEWTLTPERLTARAYSSAVALQPRRLRAWSRLLDLLDPGRRYAAPWEYRVTTRSGDRYNVQPARTASGMPALAGVPFRPPTGYKANIPPGALVIVQFADRDPSRPYIAAADAVDSTGWVTDSITIGPGLAKSAARTGDPVTGGTVIGTGSLIVSIGG